jgi:hypothetical protein
MEPKPKNINLDNSCQPEWIKQAAIEYSRLNVNGNIATYTETNFKRGNDTIEVLNNEILISPNNLNILIVGLGLYNEPISCSYEPFKISAHLEAKGVNYKMTLIDLSEKVINDVRERTTIFLPSRGPLGKLDEDIEKAWKKYLKDTEQEGRIIFNHEQELNFNPRFLSSNPLAIGTASMYLQNGIYAAKVPHQFREKLKNGDIRLLKADIVEATLGDFEKFDYAELTNVLYLMSCPAQKLALANIAGHMKDNGIILMNDIGGYTGVPIFTKFGGWLDEQKLKDLHLSIKQIIDSKESSETVLLKKI